MPEIQMPKLSDTMTEGTLVAWKKKKGEKVAAGDVIAEIETDKATMEWESPEDGVLTEIFVEEGGKVNVGDKLAFIGEEGEAAPPAAGKEEEKGGTSSCEEPAAETGRNGSACSRRGEGGGNCAASGRGRTDQACPSQKAGVSAEGGCAAEEQRWDKSESFAARAKAGCGTGSRSFQHQRDWPRRSRDRERRPLPRPKGKDRDLTKTAPTAPKIQAAEGARIHLTGMRKVIAERLVASKGPVPHFYLNIEIDAGPLMTARAELKSAGEGTDTSKITVNDFVSEGRGAGRGQSAESKRFLRSGCDRAIQRRESRDRGCARGRFGHAGDSRCADQVASRNQRSGKGSRQSCPKQAHEAGGISGRDFHGFESRQLRDRQFFRDHQSAAGIHSLDRRDHEESRLSTTAIRLPSASA